MGMTDEQIAQSDAEKEETKGGTFSERLQNLIVATKKGSPEGSLGDSGSGAKQGGFPLVLPGPSPNESPM